MASKTATHFYNEIVFLAAEIGKLGLPDQFIEAARTKSKERLEDLLDQCEAKYPQLWERLLKLYEDYEEAGEPKIFSEEGFDLYNPEEIDPINLCFVMMLSEGNMTDTDLFEDWESLTGALFEKGYIEMAMETHEASISSLTYNLMRAYK